MSLFFTFSVRAQFSVAEKIDADLAFINSYQLKLHSLIAVENYMYFSRGILPLETTRRLDENIALAEDANTHLELYNRKYGLDKFLKINGYWQSLRIKIIHAYKKGLAHKLYEQINGFHGLLGQMNNELIGKYKLSYARNELMLGKALYYSHLLSFIYMAWYAERDAYFETLLNANMKTYKQLSENLKQLKFKNKKEKERAAFLEKSMNRLYTLIENGADPADVYEQTSDIHRFLENWLDNSVF
jgi:hypothetical protein